MVSWPGAIELLRTSIVFEAIVLTVVAGDEDQCGSNLIPKLAYREETLRSSRRSLQGGRTRTCSAERSSTCFSFCPPLLSRGPRSLITRLIALFFRAESHATSGVFQQHGKVCARQMAVAPNHVICRNLYFVAPFVDSAGSDIALNERN